MQKFTYPKTEHLKSRKAIEQLFKTGQSFFIYPYKVVYQFAQAQQKAESSEQIMSENAACLLLSGFAVSSKNFKRAVARNRIKRLGREAFRLHKQPLEQQLAANNQPLEVFFIFTDKKLPDFKLIESKMQACLKKLIHLTKKHYEELLQG